MRRFSSRSLAALALVAALGVVLPVTAEAVSSAPSVDGNTEALQRLGGCIAGGAQGDILLLIDRSGSLKQTDPKGTRVDAAKYLIRQMASFAETTKAKLTVAVAGFDTSYSKESDWMPLNGASVNQAETAVERFRDQNRGVDTDYWNALAGARRDLAERAASGGEHCSTVVWFTDGAYDLDPRGNRSDLERKALGDPKPYLQGGALTTEADARAAVEAGLQDVCRPGGVADQLRSQNIVNIAVGLSTPSSSPDFTKLQAIATGAGGSCGAIVKPAPGAFFLAKDIDSLFFAFDQFATPGRAPVTQSAGICGPEVCPEGTHRFVLDPSIGSAHVLGASSASDERVMLVSPDGAQMELNRASSEQTASTSGANVAWRWVSDQAVSFDLKRSSDQKWTGQWSLAFLSPSKASGTSRSSLQIFGDLLPVWRDAPKEIRVGDKLTMTLGVGHSDGSIVDPASLTAQTTLSADVFKADGNPVAIVDKLSPQSIGAPQTLDFADSSPGQVRVRLKLVVTTQPWISPSGAVVPGTTLEPQVKDYLLTLLAPATYPAVPGTVDFGHTEKRDPVTTSLPVQGDGCVWLAETSPPVTLPQGVTSATITSSAKDQSTCVSGALPLTIAANDVGNGLLSGRFTVATVGKESGAKPIFVPVTYQLDMSRPANTTLLLGALVGITLLGVAIPLGLIYGVKFFTAKIPGASIKAGSVQGLVDDTQSFLTNGVDLQPGSLRTELLDANRRRVALASCTLVTKAGLALTEPGYVLVEQPGSPAGAGRGADRKGSQAKLPLAVQGHWCVALDAADPLRGEVQVTFFTAAGASGWADLVDDARNGVQEAVATLRASLPAVGGGAAPASSGSADGWGEHAGSAAADPWSAPSPQVVDPWGSASAGSTGQSSQPHPASTSEQAGQAGLPPSPDTW